MATTAIPTTVYPIKRGDSFQPICTITIEGDIGPYDFSGWSVRSQIRDPKNKAFVSGTTVAWIDHAAGVYQLVATVDTSTWQPCPGDLLWDIEYTTDTGEVMSTDTAIVKLGQDVTRTDSTDPESAAAI